MKVNTLIYASNICDFFSVLICEEWSRECTLWTEDYNYYTKTLVCTFVLCQYSIVRYLNPMEKVSVDQIQIMYSFEEIFKFINVCTSTLCIWVVKFFILFVIENKGKYENFECQVNYTPEWDWNEENYLCDEIHQNATLVCIIGLTMQFTIRMKDIFWMRSEVFIFKKSVYLKSITFLEWINQFIVQWKMKLPQLRHRNYSNLCSPCGDENALNVYVSVCLSPFGIGAEIERLKAVHGRSIDNCNNSKQLIRQTTKVIWNIIIALRIAKE